MPTRPLDHTHRRPLDGVVAVLPFLLVGTESAGRRVAAAHVLHHHGVATPRPSARWRPATCSSCRRASGRPTSKRPSPDRRHRSARRTTPSRIEHGDITGELALRRRLGRPRAGVLAASSTAQRCRPWASHSTSPQTIRCRWPASIGAARTTPPEYAMLTGAPDPRTSAPQTRPGPGSAAGPAQRLERPAHNRWVPGSNPGGPTSLRSASRASAGRARRTTARRTGRTTAGRPRQRPDPARPRRRYAYSPTCSLR